MDEGGGLGASERPQDISLARRYRGASFELKGGCGVLWARRRTGCEGRRSLAGGLGSHPGRRLDRVSAAVDGRLEATRPSHSRFQLTALSTPGDAPSAIRDPRADRQLRVRTPFADVVDRQTGVMPSRLPNCCAVWIPPSPPARPLASLEIPCGVPPSVLCAAVHEDAALDLRARE